MQKIDCTCMQSYFDPWILCLRLAGVDVIDSGKRNRPLEADNGRTMNQSEDKSKAFIVQHVRMERGLSTVEDEVNVCWPSSIHLISVREQKVYM